MLHAQQAYAIPMKMKYDCPVSSKSGKDLPLWKTATRCFLECVALTVANLKQMDRGLFSFLCVCVCVSGWE